MDGEGVFVASHMIGSSGFNELVVGVSREAAKCHHGVGIVGRLIRRGGGRGGGLFRVFLFSEFVGGLPKVAIFTGMTLAGTIPTLDIRIRGAGRPLIVVIRGLGSFVALSAPLRDCQCPRSGHRSRLFSLCIGKRLFDRRPGSSPAIHEVSNLRSPRSQKGGEDFTHEGAVADGERNPLEVILIVMELFKININVLFIVKRKEIELHASGLLPIVVWG